MAAVAGANWGAVAVPRVGSEVLIDFIDGDIDRPVVIGSVYNGSGARDAQNNQVGQGAGVATGNAPAWFPGEGGAHAHPAALSGIKSQAMNASQSGAGAYSQLVFDDHPGEPRVALQRHASPHAGTDELNLGHLRHQSDNQRLQTAGFGAELKTVHSAALRAGQGLLLSADARNGASGSQLDSREAQAQIEQSRELQLSLAETAQKHNAKLKDEAEPAKLAALAQMENSGKVVQATTAGAGGEHGGDGNVTAYSEQHLQLSSPAGIAAVTPASALLAAGGTSSLSAGQDINFAAQGNALHLVGKGISLFTYGKASSADKPNQETGIKLHAASGKLSVQSQSDATKLTADKLITVASVGKSIAVSAKEHVMLTAQGAFLKLEGGNIMLHGPGTMTFKASMKELTGPASASSQATLPTGKLAECPSALSDAASGGASAI
ncbi:type VI secretion system Vgr family protein [Duganella sp. HH105]|uniref:type VI secretion system Vgr family protein n=1 Tax=Duganella sp. HH105 TaxID=1781067 RepID=UPI001E366D2B|nr:type VI secretion system Vgr family protein [Duganella sp. HH105]